MSFDRGTIVLADLDPTMGHEQRGLRPCVVVSDPATSTDQRFPLLAVVPMTGTPGKGVLYPELNPRPGSGLAKASFVLIDNVRSIDKRRVIKALGAVSDSELERIDTGLRLFLGLELAH